MSAKFSLVPQIEQYPLIVKLAQTYWGKIGLMVIAVVLLWLLGYSWIWQTAVAIGFMSFLPSWRRTIVLIASMSFLVFGQGWLHFRLDNSLNSLNQNGLLIGLMERAILLALVLLVCMGIYRLFSRYKFVPLPFFWVLGGYFIILAILSYYLPDNKLGSYWIAVSSFFAGCMWFLAYSLEERHKPTTSSFANQHSHYLPFWSPGIEMPFPKGAAYLNKIEAKNARELAVSQLKGLKLLYWALILYLLLMVFSSLVYGASPLLFGSIRLVREGNLWALIYNNQLHSVLAEVPWQTSLPRYFAVLDNCRSDYCGNWLDNWAVLLGRFVTELLRSAVFFHIAIGIVRLGGFNALRGMRNPLAARTIADFWNRYDYYFKELLVNLFYLPFFLRFFRRHSLLRMYFSLMVAVFLGNFLFHFLWHQGEIMQMGIFQAMWAFHVEAVFTLILAHGIFISQWLQQIRPPSRNWFMVKFVAPIRVSGFFCLIWVFADGRMGSDVSYHFRFLFSLFGISW